MDRITDAMNEVAAAIYRAQPTADIGYGVDDDQVTVYVTWGGPGITLRVPAEALARVRDRPEITTTLLGAGALSQTLGYAASWARVDEVTLDIDRESQRVATFGWILARNKFYPWRGTHDERSRGLGLTHPEGCPGCKVTAKVTA